MNYQEICTRVAGIAREAGNFIRKERESLSLTDVETKSKASLVTYVDKTSERMIVHSLRDLLPGAGFVTEEGTAGRAGEERVWIIDPLDGTTNYIHGIFPCSVSIALMEKGEIVVGVVYELGQDDVHSLEGKRSLSERKRDQGFGVGSFGGCPDRNWISLL